MEAVLKQEMEELSKLKVTVKERESALLQKEQQLDLLLAKFQKDPPS